VRHDWGWTSSIPRGRRCSHGRDWSTTAACRITTASSLSPRYNIPARRVVLTRHHQGFPVGHPMPSLPLTCRPRTGQGLLGFPVSSAPSRHQPRTSRWGQVSNTDPKSRHRHQPTSNRRTHSPRATSRRNQLPHPAGGTPIQSREKVTRDRVWPDQLRRDSVGGVEMPDRIPVTLAAFLG